MSVPAITGFLDQLTATTRRDILPVLWDNYFKDDPVLAKLKAERMRPFRGGTQIQENFMYDTLPVSRLDALGGNTFTQQEYQLQTGGTFLEKEYGVNITLQLETIRGINRGDLAAFSIMDTNMVNAGLALSAALAIDVYQGGTRAGREKYLNGFDEQLNDGSTAGFSGNAYSTYGTIARSAVNSALSSPMTGPTANVSGPITYKTLEEAYSSLIYGSEQPDMIATTNLAFSYMKQKFFPQWRVETQDPKVGFNSMVFNKAQIVASQYCPGTRGTQDAKLGDYYLSTGETIFLLNTKTLTLHVNDDELFNFGFTGWKVAQDNLSVAGQHLVRTNITNRSPRLSRVLFGVTA